MLVKQGVDAHLPVLGDPLQLFPRIVMVLVLGAQPPDLPDGADALAADRGQVYQQKTRGLSRPGPKIRRAYAHVNSRF